MTDSEDPFLERDRFLARVAVVQVLSLEGEPLRLRECFRDRPAVIVFVRHFGCLFCHQAVFELLEHAPQIVRRGARLAIVGNGSVAHARRFAESKALPREGVMVLTDPGRDAFKAAGFERGLARTVLHPGAWSAFTKAKAQGHTGNGLFGDLTQLGGVVVAKPPASMLYFHKSRFAGDHPDEAEILAALP
jgi:hypothetical protein